jgi:protein-disulfide isomerase
VRTALIAITLLISCAGAFAAQTASPVQTPAPDAAASQSIAPPTELQKKIEAYIRELYAFGHDFTIKVSAPQPSPVPDLSAFNVGMSYNGQSDSTLVYVSKDGKFMFRGELDDLSIDPLVSTRKMIQLQGAPSKGPADSRVVLVEYADYECPSCRQLYTLLQTLLPKYPQVRLVYKDFPLTDLHPWALTAAEAARCAFSQNPTSFWKFHDSIFESQDLISPDNVYDKLLDLATQAGLNPDALRTCMSDPQTAQIIQTEQSEGQALDISSTPTIFINGRRIVGPNDQLIDQYIQYELAKPLPKPKAP